MWGPDCITHLGMLKAASAGRRGGGGSEGSICICSTFAVQHFHHVITRRRPVFVSTHRVIAMQTRPAVGQTDMPRASAFVGEERKNAELPRRPGPGKKKQLISQIDESKGRSWVSLSQRASSALHDDPRLPPTPSPSLFKLGGPLCYDPIWETYCCCTPTNLAPRRAHLARFFCFSLGLPPPSHPDDAHVSFARMHALCRPNVNQHPLPLDLTVNIRPH